MSELKLVAGEYYYDSDGAVVGPMAYSPSHDNCGYDFYDGKYFRKSNGWASDDLDKSIPTIHKHIPRSDPNHSKHNIWLEETSCRDIQTVSSDNCTLKQEYVRFVKKTFSEMEELIRQKNSDYSHGDDPFANFRKSEDINITPLAGLVLRMQDKMQRINAYLCRGTLEVPGEGVEDAFRDLIGYSCLALGMIKLDSKEENNEN